VIVSTTHRKRTSKTWNAQIGRPKDNSEKSDMVDPLCVTLKEITIVDGASISCGFVTAVLENIHVETNRSQIIYPYDFTVKKVNSIKFI